MPYQGSYQLSLPPSFYMSLPLSYPPPSLPLFLSPTHLPPSPPLLSPPPFPPSPLSPSLPQYEVKVLSEIHKELKQKVTVTSLPILTAMPISMLQWKLVNRDYIA